MGGRRTRRARRIRLAAERRRSWQLADRFMGGIIAVVLGVIAVCWALDIAKVRGEALEAVATVVYAEKVRMPSMDVDFVTASGERVETSTTDFDLDPLPKPGDRIQIVYVADDPELVAQIGFIPDFFMPIGIGGLALLAASYAALPLRRWIPACLRDSSQRW